MFIACFFVFSVLTVQNDDVADTLPSLNLWELFLNISADRSLCNLAGITPAQAKAVEKKMSSSKLNARIDKRFWQETGGIDQLQKIYLEFDPLVRVELQEIVSEFQLDEVRRIKLSRKYASSIECLSDREVLDFAGLDDAKKNQIRPLLMEYRKKHEEELEALEAESAADFFRSLPREHQELLAQYLGFAFETGIEITTNLPVASLPFEDTSFLPSELSQPERRNRLNMTQSQVERFNEANLRFDERLSTPQRDLGAHFTKCAKDAKKEMMELFSNEQLLECLRFAALNEFKRNLIKPMQRHTLAAYLKIEKPEDLSALRSTADSVNSELKEKVSELNRKYFYKITDALAPTAQNRLKKLFAAVWK